MSSDLTKTSPKNDRRKRKSDQLDKDENNKRIKSDVKIKSDEIIELSDDSNDNLKIVEEIKSDQINDKSNLEEENVQNNPMRLYLNKILNGIDKRFNNEFTLTIKEILSTKFNDNLKSSCQFSYTYDLDWLVDQYDDKFKKLPLTIVAQQKQPIIDDLKSVCKKYSNIELCFARLPGKVNF